MKVILLLELAVALVASIAFVVLYGLRSRWRTTAMGRHIMAFVLATIGEMGSLLMLGLGVKLPPMVFIVGFAFLDLVVIQRLVLLWRAQHESE